jgi:hypothetical protein
VATVVVAAAAVLSVLAYRMADTSSTGNVTTSGGTREFVEQLIPPDGSQVLQQGSIGIDLVSGWTGELTINQLAIPTDQLDGNRAGNGSSASTVPNGIERIQFTPGPGKVMKSLPKGRTCARAVVWERATGRSSSQRTVSWCFEVL